MQEKDFIDNEYGKEYVFAEDHKAWQYMVRSKRYKLLLTKNANTSLFFDLQNDPFEMKNQIHNPMYKKRGGTT